MKKYLVIIEEYERGGYSAPPNPKIRLAESNIAILKELYGNHNYADEDTNTSGWSEGDYIQALYDFCDGGDAISLWEIVGDKLIVILIHTS